jgi:ferredoxin
MSTTSTSLVVIRHKASECVGCCLCEETIPQYFQMNDEGMSELVNSTEEGVFMRANALALDFDEIEKAVEGCPVDIIRLDET